MAKFNPVGMVVGAAPLAIGGVLLYEGYFLFTGTDPYDIPLIGPDPLNALLKPFAGTVKDIIDSILALVGIGGGGGGNGNGDGCDTTCTAPQVLDSESCTCGCPNAGSCVAPQIMDEATCTCKTPPAGCTTTCIAPQVLDVATCTCKTPVTTPPPSTGACVSSRLSRYPTSHQASICDWCMRDKTQRCHYCFCQDCTTIGKGSC